MYWIMRLLQALDNGEQAHIAFGLLQSTDCNQTNLAVIHQFRRYIAGLGQNFFGFYCVIQHLTGHLEIQKLTEVIANIL